MVRFEIDMKALIFPVILFLVAVSATTAADAPVFNGPIFDTHMHYSRGAWEVYSPGEVLETMDRAKVGIALVSSTPDDGTAALIDFAPDRIVPGFRPYRTSADMSSWYKDPDLLAYSKIRLASRRHKVFGEIILYLPGNLVH